MSVVTIAESTSYVKVKLQKNESNDEVPVLAITHWTKGEVHSCKI
jgi:hypothetical protein